MRVKRSAAVSAGLVVIAVLVFAIGSANAQTGSPSAAGPAAPTAEKAEPPQQPPTPPPTVVVTATEAKPDGFTMGGFTFKVGGRIKLDIIRDFDPIGSEDSFDPRTIPVDGSEGGNSNLHAKETRLSLDMRGPVEGKELRMYVETDFYGSSSVLRLRQAYGSYGGLLAGQTWSTFVDDNNFPNTIDFESPMAFPSIRQAQLRWTQKLGAKALVVGGRRGQQVDDRATRRAYPARPSIRCRTWSTGPLRGFARARLRLGLSRPGALPSDGGRAGQRDALGRAAVGAAQDVREGLRLRQFTFGDGVGRYRGGVTAVPDCERRAAARRAHRVHGRLRALLV